MRHGRWEPRRDDRGPWCYEYWVNPIDDAWGCRIYAALLEALSGGDLTVEELAHRVGCTAHEAVNVLRRYDRASRITIVPGARDADLWVRFAERAPRTANDR